MNQKGICGRDTLMALLILFFFTLCAVLPVSAAEDGTVLLLHSYHEGLDWPDDVTDGVRSVLTSGQGDIDLYVEYMDTPRLGQSDYADRTAAILGLKYANLTFDTIICSDEYAFHFLREHHDTLFPGTPVVFCGLNYYEDAYREGWENCTGIVEAYDVGGTIDGALTLEPDIDTVYVVNDATATGLSNRQIIESLSEEYAGRLTFVHSTDGTLGEVREEVRTLPPDSIVLLMTFYRGADGEYYEYEDAAAAISSASPVPVYGVWDVYLGHGIVGGKLISGESQGRTAAGMALRIMKGEDPSSIPVITDLQGEYVYDYFQLGRYSLEKAPLPEGAAVVNRPPGSVEIDRGVLIAGVSAIAVLVIAVIFLLCTIRIRKRGERALRRSEEKFRLIAERTFDIIFAMDLQGRFTYLSPSLLRVSGYAPEECMGVPFTKTVDPVDHERCAAAIAAAAAGKSIEGLEVLFRKKDGTMIYLEINSAPVYVDGVVTGFQGVGREITERKQIEHMRSEAFDQIDRNIEQFAALGDEIRNPLAVIVGVADLYCDKEQADRIMEQTRIIDAIITRLDIGWIESEKVREFLRKH
ncbi:PAS domain S-box protein [Methanofollis fontis]|uniref:histidine kinase n=1 Tax=Methanofollis fontis TaxID=2052832 RepID=A0A483CZ19_9EURY|nr:PAS domain S-box protein [Methanofollis fontis]TAJ45542.1 hypothetical protein CUJ86_02110 [Methanofollis fontis]